MLLVGRRKVFLSAPPKAAGALALEQEGFRFGADDGSESAHTWKAAQDANTQQPLGANLLLRALVNATSDPASIAYKLKYQKNGTGGYADVPVGAGVTSPLPTYVASGAIADSAAGVAVGLPAGIATDDILLLEIETANQAVTVPTPNGGTWTEVTDSPQGTGTAAGTTATRLTVFWSRYNGTQGDPTISDSGNHQIACIHAFRGCIATGDPWDVTSGNIDATSDTSLVAPGDTTTVDNCLVCILAAIMDDAQDFGATWTNADLANITVRQNSSGIGGNDGRHILVTGEKASAGSYTDTTNTLSASSVKGMMTIALKPPAPTVNELYVATSANIAAGGEATTARLTAPSGKTTSDFVTGRRWDDENGTDSIDITTDDYTEVEWCLYAQSPAANTDYYDFRVYNADAALDTYTVTPRWTIGTAATATYEQACAGVLTFSSAATKLAAKVFAGALTMSGATVKGSYKALLGSLTMAGAAIKQAMKVLVGTLTLSGAIATSRLLVRTFDGTLTFASGTIAKVANKLLAGIFEFNVGNLLLYSEQPDNAAWSKRVGTPIVFTPNDIEAPDGTLTGCKIENLSLTNGDFWQSVFPAGAAASDRYEPSFYIQKITSTGLLNFMNPQNSANGLWVVDFSLLGSGWERITRDHAAVTITNEFSIFTTGAGHHYRPDLTDLDFYWWGGQIVKGTTATTYAKTTNQPIVPISLVKLVGKIFVGTLTQSATLVKLTSKVLAGALTSSGALAAVALKARELAGTLTMSGAFVKTTYKVLAGAFAMTGVISKLPSKVLSGTLTMAGAWASLRVYVREVAGALTLSGTLVKTTYKVLTGVLTAASTLARNTYRVLSGALATSGVVTKASSKVLSGVLTMAGSWASLRVYVREVAGTLTFASGTLAKTTYKVLIGVLTSSGSVLKTSYKILAGALSFAGATIAATARSQVVVGALAFSSTVTKRASKVLTGAAVFSGATSKHTLKIFTGTLTLSGSMVKQTYRVLAGALSFTGGVTAEWLSSVIEALWRILGVKGEDRVLKVRGENRTLAIRAEDRTLPVRRK